MKVLDYTGTSHLVSKTKTELAKKVDKVTGKGLSTNDYTNAEKQKVADSLTDAPSDGKQYARQDGDWEELDLDGKANIDGYYDTLSVGLADNLIDRKGNGTPQEISYRTSCGDDSIADDGNGIIQSIFGKTVVWNQIANPTVSGTTVNGITYTKNADGSYTANGTATSNSYFSVELAFTQKCVVGHTYYMEGVSGGSSSTYRIRFFGGYVEMYNPRIYTMTQAAFSDAKDISLRVMNGTTVNNLKFNPKVYDLTQLFGSGNEPTTVDDPRIEWIKQYATAHPEYNSGELISYNGSGIKTVGFNQWDEVWEEGTINVTTGNNQSASGRIRSINYIPVMPNTTYYMTPLTARRGRGCFYDAEKNFISGDSDFPPSSGLFTTPNDCYYLRFSPPSSPYGTPYKNDICINLSWSGYRNGEYEPYWSRTLNLPISQYFPDGMKSAGSVRDEMTKDKASERAGTITFDGSENWAKVSSANRYYVEHLSIPNKKQGSSVEGTTNRYVYVQPKASSSYLSIGQVCFYNNATPSVLDGVYVWDDSITTLEAFKSSLASNPLTINYELATPTETTITPPLDLTYKVADFGTEESIAEGKSTPFNGIIKYSDDFTRGLVNMPKNYDTTASLDALATSLSTMLTSALDGTVTITRGAYDSTNKKYAWNCTFTPNA